MYNSGCVKNTKKCYLQRINLILYGTFPGLGVVNEDNESVLTTKLHISKQYLLLNSISLVFLVSSIWDKSNQFAFAILLKCESFD